MITQYVLLIGSLLYCYIDFAAVQLENYAFRQVVCVIIAYYSQILVLLHELLIALSSQLFTQFCSYAPTGPRSINHNSMKMQTAF